MPVHGRQATTQAAAFPAQALHFGLFSDFKGVIRFREFVSASRFRMTQQKLN